ncbi:piggyBac transposable element-derived protein 1 [Octopus bimaculoides]|uniref:PiggyBac transposable element-derived protein domain-containing protein n=1 Tax=Octopus bimaculoides TaxID=37653 RepID=A0A0L8I6V8_OCTBM|nr:piggyBac transposable element-derived protein 1 [Octopus bimaculoides]|eukprot:XP_014790403.1 PREDICTED: piggyBac transposable element-derived protein 1-like [Octopus bimaculoides]
MSKRKLDGERNTEEILNIIESADETEHFIEEFDNADELQLVPHSPNDGDDTDKDDSSSDSEESLANLRDIGRGILVEKGEIRAYSKAGVEVLDVDTEVKPSSAKKQCSRSKKSSRKWNNKPLRQSSAKHDCDSSVNKPSITTRFRNKFEPTDVFREYYSKNIMSRICRETVKYVVQKGDLQFTLSVKDLYKYFGILLLLGYDKLPCRRMYWETRSDSNNYLVSQAISRNMFEKTLTVNLILVIKSTRLGRSMRNLFSLGEAMRPYYGHHGMKRFIRGKPTRYSFRLWCLARPDS